MEGFFLSPVVRELETDVISGGGLLTIYDTLLGGLARLTGTFNLSITSWKFCFQFRRSSFATNLNSHIRVGVFMDNSYTESVESTKEACSKDKEPVVGDRRRF
jgi:hypothetical protein